ncbi:AbrB/MazE/SpoVT family DNA-binding domain-containing protein [Candidatus Dependentiae bacterium]|nr:AbrB/MazE/SpoVT family DNA-binding domain-containing protein [Candidatus Dependentiae bacterium]
MIFPKKYSVCLLLTAMCSGSPLLADNHVSLPTTINQNKELRTIMIKKLVRYGNSNALVIDRAILELLNISEGSLVKMSTDGKSLIVTPEANSCQVITTEDVADQMGMFMAENMRKANDPVKMQQTMNLYNNPELLKEKTAAVTVIMGKYATDRAKLMTPEAIDAIHAIQAKYKDTMNAPEYIKEMTDLTYSIAPNLRNMQAEIDELNKNTPLTLTQTVSGDYAK